MMVIMRPIRLTKAELCVQLCVQTRRVCQPNTCLYAVLKRFQSFVIVSVKLLKMYFYSIRHYHYFTVIWLKMSNFKSSWSFYREV